MNMERVAARTLPGVPYMFTDESEDHNNKIKEKELQMPVEDLIMPP